MRKTTVFGLDDGLSYDLDGDVGVICAVMEIGRARDELIYEARLSGAELLALLERCRYGTSEFTDIKETNRYAITAYDW